MRLPNGYGSITKLKGHRRKPYLVRTACKYPDPENVKTEQRQILGYYATKSEALAALAEYNADPYDLSAHAYTFAEVFEKWSSVKFPKVSKASAYSYTASYKKCESIYQLPFKDIRLFHLQSIMDVNPEKSKSTATNLRLLFMALFDFAIKHDICDKDYSNFVELVYKNSDEAIHKPFTEDEIAALWERSASERMAALTLILIYSGWRASEFLAMQIDFDDLIMTGGVKTAAGKNRIVPIHSRILPLLKKHATADGKINFEGEYIQFYNEFKQELTNHLPHDTRHTFISRLQSAGADHVCIERLSGHASHGVTDKIYTHKTIEELRKNIELLP